jgi:dolichol-phosphate mannosyltransferase
VNAAAATTPAGDPAGPSGPDVRTSIVLATLNERGNLPEVLDRIRRQGLPALEILIVDDGSNDGTREYVLGLSLADPRVRLLRHEGKQTTLRAQCQGIEAARGDRIVVMDGDLQHPPELIPSMLRELDQGAALAIASRYVSGGSAGPRTVYRWTASRVAEWLTRILLPSAHGIEDPVSGFFAFRREIWMPLHPEYRGYKLGIFLLVMAEGRPVREVPFRFTARPEGTSKVAGGTAFMRVFVNELLLARRMRSRLRHGPRGGGGASTSRSPTGYP